MTCSGIDGHVSDQLHLQWLLPIFKLRKLSFCIVNMLKCACVCVCVCVCVRVCACAYVHRIVSTDKILRFINTFIIII